MAKKYLGRTVYDVTVERINYIFDEFEKIYVSFSGGKDSGVLLNMCIDEARKRKRRIGCLFIDLEAWYEKTVEYIERMLFDNEDVLDPYWVCLPMESDNSLSYLEPTWIWWDKGKEPLWVRPMPKHKCVINEANNPFDFYKQNMPFEEFIKYFGDWYGQGQKTACLVGIRTDESLNRFRAIVMDKSTYEGRNYSTKISDVTYNFYPLYDWTTQDIWIYNGKFEKDYNRLYDLFYKAGISIHKMRVDEPFGNEAKAGLNMFRIIEPKTWQRVVNRVSGANFGNFYSGSRIMTSRYKLPKNHTWKSFTEFLLNTLPKATADNYRVKFKKFTDYWMDVGCPMRADLIKKMEEICPQSIINTHQFSKRGTGDKEVIKFTEIVDEIPGVDNLDDVLSWRRMAMCIIKNDYLCQSLSFGITKDLTERQIKLVDKYKKL